MFTGSRKEASREVMILSCENYETIIVPLNTGVWRGLPAKVNDRVLVTGVTNMGEYWQAMQACSTPMKSENEGLVHV